MALTALRIYPVLILHLASVLPKRKNTSAPMNGLPQACRLSNGLSCPVNDCAQPDGLKNIEITYTTLLFASTVLAGLVNGWTDAKPNGDWENLANRSVENSCLIHQSWYHCPGYPTYRMTFLCLGRIY
jgi:hypothetical protein